MRPYIYLLALLLVWGAISVGWAEVPSERRPLVWGLDMAQAFKAAKAGQKPVLVVFSGSDWCNACTKLKKEVFERAAFDGFARENLVLLLVDFPRRKRLGADQVAHNEKVAERYNPKGLFPLVLLLDAEGQVLGRTGYRKGGAGAYVVHLQALLQPARAPGASPSP